MSECVCPAKLAECLVCGSMLVPAGRAWATPSNTRCVEVCRAVSRWRGRVWHPLTTHNAWGSSDGVEGCRGVFRVSSGGEVSTRVSRCRACRGLVEVSRPRLRAGCAASVRDSLHPERALLRAARSNIPQVHVLCMRGRPPVTPRKASTARLPDRVRDRN